MIVSTCHRSEIYGLADGPGTDQELTRLIAEWRGVDFAEASQSSFSLEGAEAARHLFRVASGLDSMALGESEVLGQVRSALRLARETGSTRAVLHRLFESAVATGKRVRTETEIARHPLSVASIGFELATKVFEEINAQTVLVLGAGDTGTLFAQQATEAGVRDIRVANRNADRAAALAGRIGGVAVSWEALASVLAEADLVVGATSSPTVVVGRDRSSAPCASAGESPCSSWTSRFRATSTRACPRSTTSTPTESTSSRAWPRRTAAAGSARSPASRPSWRRSSAGFSRGTATSPSCRL